MKQDQPIVVITGAAGFIGSNLIKALDQSFNVIAVDFFENCNWENLKNSCIYDFLQPHELLKIRPTVADKQIKAIFHMGAISSTTSTDFKELIEKNTKYSIDLIRKFGGGEIKVVYASSAAVYGKESWNQNEAEIFSPTNAYGASKLWVDRIARGIPNVYGLRYFNVYGPGEDHKIGQSSPVLKFFHEFKENGKIKLFKSYDKAIADGEQKRDFIFIDDVVEATTWIAGMGSLKSNESVFELQHKNRNIFNIGTGKAETFLTIGLECLKNLTGNSGKVDELLEWVETPENIQKHYQSATQANMTNFLDCGGKSWWRPHTTQEGVEKYINFLNSNLRGTFHGTEG